MPEEVANIPLVFDAPVYGTHELTFTDFMAPGIILTIVHSMALGYSAMIIIMERNEGLLDRTWIAGEEPGGGTVQYWKGQRVNTNVVSTVHVKYIVVLCCNINNCAWSDCIVA